MKKILINLIVIIILGFITIGHSKAEKFEPNVHFRDPPKFTYTEEFICFDITNGTVFVGRSDKGWVPRVDNIENICEYFVYKNQHKIYKKLKNYLIKVHGRGKFNYGVKYPIAEQVFQSFLGKKPEKKYSKILHEKIKYKRRIVEAKERDEESQIAKAEPSQTQKVAKKTIFENTLVTKKGKNEKILRLRLCKNFNNYEILKDNLFCSSGYTYPSPRDRKNFLSKNIICFEKAVNRVSIKKQQCSSKVGEFKVYYHKNHSYWFYEDKNIKVAKVKVEEPKQEEFKPENKDIDNDAPVIEVAQNITVSDTSYVIEGKVSDKSDKIFVEIDGQPIEVRKGKFKAKRYSPVDEQVKIVAIDQWGNKSKPKIVNIKINIEETVVAENLEPLNPSNIRTKSSNEKIAIIIGIENYSEAPKANYANLDAQYFFDYARKAFGVKKQNINLLINENATVVKTDKALSLWLKSKIKKNRSDLIIFFAGHGLASTDGKELYLLPQDGNPDRLERTALSRTDLFKEIINLNPKSVTMFLDTCYSGVSRDEQMLLASARPIRIVADEQDGIPDNFTIFSASKLDQISSGLKEAKHGIFSYYLMKGLEGNADSNEDKKITNGELLAYMDENVSQKAAEQGREQNPSLAGDPDKVLISYR